jgi:P4 family phage/plasmid primase-like protien
MDSAIQIIGLRPFTGKDGKEKKKHELYTTVESIPWMFKNLPAVIEKIPEAERWNVYFTCLNCQDPRTVKGQLRRFKSQEIFPFDIDGISLDLAKRYVDIFFKITALDPERTVVICSGNGLQFFAQFIEPFTDPLYFDQKRLQYKAICERVDKLIAEEKLPGRADPSVWSPARLMRLPDTENRKPGKENKRAFVIHGNLSPQEIDWNKMSGVAEVKEDEHIAWDQTRAPKLDHKEMYKGCNFLKATIEDAGSIREPHYYAALSLIARMENGRERAHHLAEAIKDSGNGSTVAGYGHQDIEKKIDQALQASGPRTCKSINSIWGKCSKCPNFAKVVSPVSLRGEDHIATKETGFHNWVGKDRQTPKPNFYDLIKHYDQLHLHKSIMASGVVFAWDGKKYDLQPYPKLQGFSTEHFNPKPSLSSTKEFAGLLGITNLVPAEFFGADLTGYINFQNGVLNVKTKELLPHAATRGFRYVLPYAYDPTAKAPRFEQFLDEVVDGDQELRAVLEEFGGYCLSGDNYWLHHCLLLIGTGRNGKSKYIEALQLAAGEDNFSTTKLEKFGSQNDLQLMEGKLFNVSEEISHREMKLTESLKDLSSGNTITVKLMYNQPYKIKNKAKLVLTANTLPESTDSSFAFFDRMLIVPFNQNYETNGKKDPFLAEKFKAELPGIFNVLFRGYERLVKNKRFSKSMQIERSKLDYKQSNNPIYPWWESRMSDGRIIEKPLNGRQDFVFTGDLFMDFCIWNQTFSNQVRINYNQFSHWFASLVADGEARRGKARQWVCRSSRGTKLDNPRSGFYDIQYNPDMQRQKDTEMPL